MLSNRFFWRITSFIFLIHWSLDAMPQSPLFFHPIKEQDAPLTESAIFDEIDGEQLDDETGPISLDDLPQWQIHKKLFEAIEKDDKDLLAQLLVRQADPWVLDEKNYLPLHYAASWHRYECIDVLLQSFDQLKNGQREKMDYLITTGGKYYETPLYLAVASGCREEVISSVQAMKNCKKTIRILLSVIPEEERIRYLVGDRAKLYSPDNRMFIEETVLSYAVRIGVLPIIETLISMVPEELRYWCLTALHTNQYNLLHIAVSSGQSTVVELLISLLPREKIQRFINSRAGDGDTALHIAASKNNADMVAFLLVYGADPLARDICEQTAAEVTTSAVVKEVIKQFLNKQKQ